MRCGEHVARSALAQGHTAPITLALLFTSHPQPEAVLRGVNAVLPDVPLIGTTSLGEYSHEGYVEQGAGLMLIRGDGVQFSPLGRKRPRLVSRKLLGKLRGISPDGLGHFTHRSLMLFPDNQFMKPDNLVQKALSETAMLYDIVGGSGLTDTDRRPNVFYYDKVLKGGLSGTEVLSQKPLGLALANGWQPVSQVHRVTHSDANCVVKIDGRPAREVYEDFVMEQTGSPEIDTDVLLRYPLGICDTDTCKVSMIMEFDQRGAMLVTSPPPAGSLVYFLGSQPDAMLLAARRAVDQAMRQVQHSAGALFIDCMSTRLVLGDAHRQQQQVVRDMLGDVPFLGFRSQGVIARLQGQISGHYECSVATCILPE
jgi:hypothetical protein